MPDIAHSAHDMISGMTPQVRPGSFVFVTVQDAAKVPELMTKAIAMFHEEEGVSLIVPIECAETTDHPMACITLHVYSALDGVGLTAAVATALADHGIACNMVAAYHHDHAFVPEKDCDRAMAVLLDLQKQAGQ